MEINQTFIEKIKSLGEQEYMSDAIQSVFNDELIRRLELNQAGLDECRVEVSGLDMKAPDEVEAAGKAAELEEIQRKRAVYNQNSLDIKNALKYMKLGDFGFCATCGGEIGMARLLSVPTALRDIECQHVADHNEKTLLGRSRTISIT